MPPNVSYVYKTGSSIVHRTQLVERWCDCLFSGNIQILRLRSLCRGSLYHLIDIFQYQVATLTTL